MFINCIITKDRRQLIVNFWFKERLRRFGEPKREDT